jgi:4-aminobutyrate aminotransferase-like enzyme/Ser/Thr protein kinase RdoA (MazF antagonist)
VWRAHKHRSAELEGQLAQATAALGKNQSEAAAHQHEELGAVVLLKLLDLLTVRQDGGVEADPPVVGVAAHDLPNLVGGGREKHVWSDLRERWFRHQDPTRARCLFAVHRPLRGESIAPGGCRIPRNARATLFWWSKRACGARMAATPQTEHVLELVQDLYGIGGTIAPLAGEHDLNYRITTGEGDYVLKIAPAGAQAAALELSIAALAHLERAATALPVPKVRPARNGKLLEEAVTPWGERRLVRLLSWLPGRVWAESGLRDGAARAELGRVIARVDRALADFHHERASTAHPWSPFALGELGGEIGRVVDAELRAAVAAVHERFRTAVAVRLSALPFQVIHNDANDYNVVVDDDGRLGLVDFGDVVLAPRVCGLAVGLAYALIGQAAPIAAARALVAGYHEEAPLEPAELELLWDLTQARLAQSVLMAVRQSASRPDNEYLLVSQGDVGPLLLRLRQESAELAHCWLREACGLAANPATHAIHAWLATPAGDPRAIVDGAATVHRYRDISCGVAGSAWVDGTVHLGVDLATRVGTPVRTPLAGIVSAVGSTPAGAGAVLVEHSTTAGQRFYTLIAGITPSVVVSLGVAAGAIIGEADGSVIHVQHLTYRPTPPLAVPSGALLEELAFWESLSPDPAHAAALTNGAATPSRPAGELARRRRVTLSRALSLSYREPLKIVRGEGAYLIDVDGRRFLDMVNNVCHVGHAHPRVVAAAAEQMAALNTNTRYLHDAIVAYARELAATLPDPLSTCFFVNSGSEANDLALRLARAATGRRAMLVLDHAYHGNLTSLIDLSPYKFNGPGGRGCPADVRVCEIADPYRGRLRSGEPEIGARYAADVLRQIDSLRAAGLAPAALLAESIPGCAGQVVLPDGYLRAAYEHVRAAGGVCIADEVQTGFGRVGEHTWAFELGGVVPDIVTMGKPIGNGHPLGAVVTTPAIAHAFVSGMEYFNTFGGNPVSCTVGLAVLQVMREERLQARAARVGGQLLAGLRELQVRHELIGDVRGHGLFIGVELVCDRATRAPAGAGASLVADAAKQRGVLLSTDGPYHNVIKLKPPLAISSADAELCLNVLDQALTEVEATTRA